MLRLLLSAVMILLCPVTLAASHYFDPESAGFGAMALPSGEQSLACVGSKSASDCAQSLFGFGVSFTETGDNVYTWKLTNYDAQAVITRVYLELTEEARVINMKAADAIFTSGKKVKDLPGGKGINFETNWFFEADKPAPHNGVAAGDSLSITFTLPENYGLTSDSLGRFGFYAQTGKYSGTFVTNGNALTPVPLPGSGALLGAGALGLGLTSMRHTRRRRG